MRPVDVCTTILITPGNHALRGPPRTRWDEVEELMGLSLRPTSRQPSRVMMLDEQGGRPSRREVGWGCCSSRINGAPSASCRARCALPGLSFEGPNAPSYRVLSDRLLATMRAGYRAGINTSAT